MEKSCWCKNLSYRLLIKDSRQKFKIVRCMQCGLVRVFPIPDSSKDRYAGYNIGGYLKNKKLFVSFMNQILKEVLKFKKSGCLLEIGCGVGYFLELAQEQGFDIQGTELSQEAIKTINKNLGNKIVKKGFLSEINFSQEYFDVIVMNHVLEHILDLNKFLGEVNRILKKDGILVIGSPNFNGLFAKLTKRKWPGLRPKEHIWQFEPKSISNILKINGFKILRLKRKSSHNFQSITISLKERQIKYFLLNTSNLIFGLLGKGDNMIIIAKK